ncbi:hypothetical protein D3C87_1779110 [compost metagenome]
MHIAQRRILEDIRLVAKLKQLPENRFGSRIEQADFGRREVDRITANRETADKSVAAMDRKQISVVQPVPRSLLKHPLHSLTMRIGLQRQKRILPAERPLSQAQPPKRRIDQRIFPLGIEFRPVCRPFGGKD